MVLWRCGVMVESTLSNRISTIDYENTTTMPQYQNTTTPTQ